MTVPPEHYVELARDYIAQNSTNLSLSIRSNPVEIGGLIGLFVALLLDIAVRMEAQRGE